MWSGLRGNRLLLIGASASIGVVWWVYSYGVVSGMAVDVSLGYFACPLVGLLLAAMVEHDSVSALSWLAGLLGISALAASGVLMGKVPWVALSISVAFALYGLFKKRLGARGVSNLASLYGEGIVLLPGAVVGLVVVQASEGLAFGRAGFAFESLLLLFAGGLTLLPLWLFSSGVRTLQLGVTSTLQFINPAIQLLIGTLVLHEPMTLARWVAILLVWAALLCAMVDLSIPRGRPSVRPMTAADAPRKWEQV